MTNTEPGAENQGPTAEQIDATEERTDPRPSGGMPRVNAEERMGLLEQLLNQAFGDDVTVNVKEREIAAAFTADDLLFIQSVMLAYMTAITASNAANEYGDLHPISLATRAKYARTRETIQQLVGCEHDRCMMKQAQRIGLSLNAIATDMVHGRTSGLFVAPF